MKRMLFTALSLYMIYTIHGIVKEEQKQTDELINEIRSSRESYIRYTDSIKAIRAYDYEANYIQSDEDSELLQEEINLKDAYEEEYD